MRNSSDPAFVNGSIEPDVVQPVLDLLVKRVETGWRRAGYAQQDFPSIATEALLAVAPHTLLDPRAAIRSLAAGENRDGFVGVHGSPQIVPLFTSPRFNISLHLWEDEIQTPHSHGWCGAYQVLDGTSVQGLFTFDEHHRYDAKFLLGRLTLDRLELLDPGATVPVIRGLGMIHGMNYVSETGMAISIRSYENAPAMTHDFLEPGVAIQGSHVDQATLQRMRCFETLCAIDPARAHQGLMLALRAADPRTCFWILRHSAVHFRPHLDMDALFEEVAPKFGAYADAVKLGVETWEREVLLRLRRRAIDAADHRFLIAVMHLARDRATIEQLVASRFEEEPTEFVVRCLTEMATTSREPGFTLLGTPSGSDFGAVLGLLLEDDRTESVLSRLEDEYDPEQVREMAPLLRETCASLRALPVLRPVFATSVSR